MKKHEGCLINGVIFVVVVVVVAVLIEIRL
jgi:hypothetical protein